jgi:hypothetical protein
MPVICPPIHPNIIVGDDPFLVARLSCALSRKQTYLSVIDGPRMTRLDHTSEVTRRNNAIVRARADKTLLAGVTGAGLKAMRAALPTRHAEVVTDDDVVRLTIDQKVRDNAPLKWGLQAIGLGLLRALNERRLIEFGDYPSPSAPLASRSGHVVVCETGEALSEVIAANYAYSMGAGLHLIGETDEEECKYLLESYYGINQPGVDQGATRQRIQSRMRELCGSLDLAPGGSITFITRRLPFGLAFPELPSTHLFTYPDLGIAVINGFAAEQLGTRGVNVAVLVDPGKVRAPEIDAAARILPSSGMFVRGYKNEGATVRNVTEMVELFPYDLLIFATHCGDASGWRWTYRYIDSEGIDRTLVVDIAIGIASTDDPKMLHVVQYVRFVSLDGIDWNDPVAKKDLYVGTAILDYTRRERDEPNWEPVHKEEIPRVIGSAAMVMADHNYIAMPRSLASEGSPIIINNACVSWHELASRFMFNNARAYIGTITDVSDLEAEAIILRLLDKHFGKPLAHGVWSAQNATYGHNSDRRPYVVTGVYPQRLRSTPEDAPRRIFHRLIGAARHWQRRLIEATGDERLEKDIRAILDYYKRELLGFKSRWFRKD